MIEIVERIEADELVVSEQGNVFLVIGGFHFPIEVDDLVLERMRIITEEEETMKCPECGGTGCDGHSFCPTCQGSGELASDGSPKNGRHAKRKVPSHNPRRAEAVPARIGHNDRKPIHLRFAVDRNGKHF